MDVFSLTMFKYTYFEYNVNVADMARELAFGIDKEAEKKGDYSAPSELFVIKKAHAMKETHVLRRSTRTAPVATSGVNKGHHK
jgi:hypothetical protein